MSFLGNAQVLAGAALIAVGAVGTVFSAGATTTLVIAGSMLVAKGAADNATENAEQKIKVVNDKLDTVIQGNNLNTGKSQEQSVAKGKTLPLLRGNTMR